MTPRFLVPFFLFVSSSTLLLALPQRIGAPLLGGGLGADGRDLTMQFLDAPAWDGIGKLDGHWETAREVRGRRVDRLTKAPSLFGHLPVAAEASYLDNELERVSIYYLESGLFYGFTPQNEREADALREQERLFEKAQKDLTKNLSGTLRRVTKDRPRTVTDSVSTLLKLPYTQYGYKKLAVQLRSRERAYVRVDILRQEDAKNGYFDKRLASLGQREKEGLFEANVRKDADGTVAIDGVPCLNQGGSAYCGLTAFLMATEYFGVEVDAPTLASISGFRYGFGGNKMLEAYEAVSREGALRLNRATTFNFDHVKASIDEGRPVLVWRKFDDQRDRLHRRIAGRLKDHPEGIVELPAPDEADRATWPGKGHPNHASVITGYHADRGEVIFSESWGEGGRDKRMRAEEMAGTAYMTFFFRL